ncbi:MAG: methyltransferase [Pseudomonadota bacterium]
MSGPRKSDAHAPPKVDDRAIYDLAMGIAGAQAVLVALDLGVFEFLEKGPADLAAIAAQFGLPPRGASAMLDACVAHQFILRDGEHFRLSEISATYLTPESPTYMGDFLKAANIAQPDVNAFPSVRRSIVENRTQVYDGEELFESHAVAAERARAFTMMMHGHSISSALTWPLNFDLSQSKQMIDIGGGSGAHAIGATLRWPALKATVFDMESVVSVAEEMIGRYGVTDQVSVRAGDFWQEPIPGGDLHFYGDILHDWPDEKCRFLLEKSFAALEPGGRLMIHEILYDDDKSGPVVAASLSVIMLLWTEGRQRTAKEYKDLLSDCGFANVEVAPAFGYWSIVSAQKPK